MNLIKSYGKPVLKDNTPVIIKGLGNNNEYTGIVVGVSYRLTSGENDIMYYMIKFDPPYLNYPYSVMLLTPSCVFADESEFNF